MMMIIIKIMIVIEVMVAIVIIMITILLMLVIDVGIWSWVLVQLCPGFLFIFLKFSFFGLLGDVGGTGGGGVVKGQKITQNEKQQLHPSHAISQKQYSIWSNFLVHLCKMMISPEFFFFFHVFHFYFLSS